MCKTLNWHMRGTKRHGVYAVVVCCAIVAAVSCFLLFSTATKQAITDEEISRMSEIADIYAKQIDSKLNSYVHIIRTTADQMRAVGGDDSHAAEKIMSNTVVGTNFTEIKLERSDARHEPLDAKQYRLSHAAIMAGRSAICALKDGGGLQIAIMVPVMKNGRVEAVVCGMLNADALNDAVNRRIFGGDGKGVVVSSNGYYVIGGETGNYFSSISGARILLPYDYDKIRSSIRARKRFYYISENKDGARDIVFANPIGSVDWSVLVIVSDKYVAGKTANATFNVLLLVLSMGVMVALMLFFVLFAERASRKSGEAAAKRRELLIRNTPGVVQRCAEDSAFTYEYVSDNFAEYAGYNDKSEFLAACRGSFWNSILPEDREKTKKSILEQLDKDGHYEVVYRLCRKDGNAICLLCRGSRATGEDGHSSVYGVAVDITQRHKAANELRVSQERYSAAIAGMNIAVLEYDTTSDQMLITGNLRRFFTWPAKVEGFSKWIKSYAEDGGPSIEKMLRELMDGCESSEASYEKLDSDSAVRWLHTTMHAIRESNGRLIRAVGVTQDWTERREMELRYLSSQKYKNALAKLYDRIFEIDVTHDRVIAGREYETGTRADSEKGSVMMNAVRECFVHPDDRALHGRYSDVESVRRLYASGVTEGDIEFRAKRSMGEDYVWRAAHIMIYTDPSDRSLRTLWFVKDAGKISLEMKELEKLVVLDPLTGLYNKESTNMAIINRLISSGDDPASCSALLLVDLDDFKKTNDEMGHIVGDAILIDLANKLREIFRSGDIIGRVGGDEFVVFMSNLPDKKVAAKKAEELRRSLVTFRRTREGDEPTSASIGISFAPADGNDFETLFQKADVALYRSKDLGKGRVSLYDAGMDEDARPRTKAAEITADVEHVDRELFFKAPAPYIFRLLNMANNSDAAIRGALELAVRLLGATRGYIFENSHDNRCFSEMYEVVGSKNVGPTIKNFQNLSYSEIRPDYDKLFDSNGVYLTDVADARPDLRASYESQGMIKLLQVAVLDKGVFRGFVGFDFCDSEHLPSPRQISHLTIVGEILATAVGARMKEKERQTSLKNIEAAMRLLNDKGPAAKRQ